MRADPLTTKITFTLEITHSQGKATDVFIGALALVLRMHRT
jgi:hypothetical protein